MRIARTVIVADKERRILQRWSRGRRVAARLVMRANIVLMAAAGKMNKEIASELGIGTKTVCLWRSRFCALGVAGIEKDAPRGGRPATARAELVAAIIRKTTMEKPRTAARWSTRTLAAELGTSPAMVQRVWKAHRLKPHRLKTEKKPGKSRINAARVGVVGWYLSPAGHVIALCVDKQSRSQSVERVWKDLRIHPGHGATITHLHQSGTAMQCGMPGIAAGLVIEACASLPLHQEWLRFLKAIDGATRPDAEIHLVADECAAHEHPTARRWLADHPRFQTHCASSSNRWLRLAERKVCELMHERRRPGTIKSVRELQAAVGAKAEQGHDNGTATDGLCVAYDGPRPNTPGPSQTE